MTVGELLARQLKGDTSITYEEIESATNRFFNSKGIACEASVKKVDKNKGTTKKKKKT